MIVDIQGLVAAADHSFLVKEMTAVDLDSMSLAHWVFKHPNNVADDKKTTYWLKKYMHGLDTEIGDVEYAELPKIMSLLRCETIYVKGVQKKQVLQQYLPGQRVIEIEEECPPLRKLCVEFQPRCIRHMNNYEVCSLYKAMCLKQWLIDNS